MAEDEDANIISKMEKKKADPVKEGLNNYSKYAVGGESKEVPASAGLDENDNFIHGVWLLRQDKFPCIFHYLKYVY